MDHEESSPEAASLLITQLSCSLFGESEELEIIEEGVALTAYGRRHMTENYRCNYGLNPDYRATFNLVELPITVINREGEMRVVELRGHPYFVATLFLPQLNSAPQQPHPLISRFLIEAQRLSKNRSL